MTVPEAFSTGVAHTIGRYSDAVRVPAGYEQIVTSGTGRSGLVTRSG